MTGDLRLVAYGAANGISAGGRRGGIAAVTPEALEMDQPALDLLLRHLALQLRMGISRHTARATMLWLYTSASSRLYRSALVRHSPPRQRTGRPTTVG